MIVRTDRVFAQYLDELADVIHRRSHEARRHLEPGYLESVYRAAIALELYLRGVPFTNQKPTAVLYKWHEVSEGRLDFLASDGLVVEAKAVDIGRRYAMHRCCRT